MQVWNGNEHENYPVTARRVGRSSIGAGTGHRSNLRHLCNLWIFLSALSGCGGGKERAPEPASTTPPATQDTRPAIVFLGTSLTAGRGLDLDQAYPALIQRKVDSAGLDYRVVNAGVSGQTSAGSLRQFEWLLGHDTMAVLVVETGANDGLRGLDPDSLKANLEAIVRRARAASPRLSIVLVGMETLTNMGPRYRRRFHDVYPAVAREFDLPLVPFLLAGVGGVDTLNQADGIHPTARGQEIVAGNVWKVLEPVLRSR